MNIKTFWAWCHALPYIGYCIVRIWWENYKTVPKDKGDKDDV